MTNVISLSVPQRRQPFIQNANALVSVFTDHHRHHEDVFWLKENAELLNILECTGTPITEDALFNPSILLPTAACENEVFFAQCYRFYLSICLNLEDLGLKGDVVGKMCD